MKNVYAINFYNETAHTGPEIAGIYATEELAVEQLRRWRKGVEDGKWDGATFVKWHDSDTEEVTWMRIARKGYRYFTEGVTEEHCYSVESISVKETEDDLDR
jgi:hypothetical protein